MELSSLEPSGVETEVFGVISLEMLFSSSNVYVILPTYL